MLSPKFIQSAYLDISKQLNILREITESLSKRAVLCKKMQTFISSAGETFHNFSHWEMIVRRYENFWYLYLTGRSKELSMQPEKKSHKWLNHALDKTEIYLVRMLSRDVLIGNVEKKIIKTSLFFM